MACKRGYCRCVSALLEAGANPNLWHPTQQWDDFYTRPLAYLMANKSDESFVQLLLDHGAEPDAHCLMLAFLVPYSAEVQNRVASQTTLDVSDLASMMCNAPILGFEHAALAMSMVRNADSLPWEALLEAVIDGESTFHACDEVVRGVIAFGKFPLPSEADTIRLLRQASGTLVRELVGLRDSFPDVFREKADQWLLEVCEARDLEKVRCCVDVLGANPSGRREQFNGEERTPLFLAVRESSPSIARFLLERGAEVGGDHGDSHDSDWGPVTIMSEACIHGSTELVNLLIEYGFKIDHEAVEFSIILGHVQCLELLLRHGATIPRCSFVMECVPILKAAEGHDRMVAFLRAHGVGDDE